MAHIDREVAVRPELIQIENGWRNAREQRPGVVQRGVFREIETVVENLDAEGVLPCEAARPAIIVYGKRVGTTITVCTDNHCPVHDPRASAAQVAMPAPQMPSAVEAETDEEAEQRSLNHEQQRKESGEEQERRAEGRRLEDERREKEWEGERDRREKLQQARQAKFDRILENAPAIFSAAQLRVFLRALVNLNPYTFVDGVAEHFAAEQDNEERYTKTSEEILLSTLEGVADDKLTGFALRLVLTGHTAIPRESEIDFLTEAEAAFAPPQTRKKTASKRRKPNPSKADTKPGARKAAAKRKATA